MSEIDLKKEYYLEGSNEGCLLIHGFTSTPAELRELGEALSVEGYSVLGVKLKGHGTTIEDMEQCTYEDWIQSSIEAYNQLKLNCDVIYVIGHSMGALLALQLAANNPVRKVIALAPALVHKDKRANLAFILKHFMHYNEWEYKARPADEEKYLLGYSKVPIKSLHQLNKLQKAVKKELYKITSPILVVHAKKDEAVDFKSISLIEKSSSSKLIKAVYLEKCGHNITVECEKEIVLKEVIDFIK